MSHPPPSLHVLAVRTSKTILVLFVALFCLIVSYNNVVDYGSNYTFVQHVMTMDTTFPDNRLKDRAIPSPLMHQIAYGLIIAGELTAGLLNLAGSVAMFRHLRSDRRSFSRATVPPVAGLTIGIAIWFFGFMTVASEWFLMWQSQQWNAVQAAFRFVICLAVVLIFLTQTEADE